MWCPTRTISTTNHVGDSTWNRVVFFDCEPAAEAADDTRNVVKLKKKANKLRTKQGIETSKQIHSKIPKQKQVDKRFSKPYKREPRMTQRFAMKQVIL